MNTGSFKCKKMILTTPLQMKELDKKTIYQYGIPGLILMENAANEIARYIMMKWCNKSKDKTVRINVLIICGKGNNGGDGFAAARKLFAKDYGITILVLSPEEDITGDAKTNMEICKALNLDLVFARAETIEDTIAFCLMRADLIVDGIFGTGFRGRPEGVYKTTIDLVNQSHKQVVAIDIPSGLDGRYGMALGSCVKADVTLALGALKIGLVTGPDIGLAGRVELLDIGIPKMAIESASWDTYLIERDFIRNLLPKRKKDVHKGDFGRIAAITGSPGMTGAGCLVGNAAFRAGAGLVYLIVPGSLSEIFEVSVQEAITVCAGMNTDRVLKAENAKNIIDYTQKMDVIAIGPGLSMDLDTQKAVKRIVFGVGKPIVVDADALNAIASDISILSGIKTDVVLTPHPAEMARLMNVSVEAISKNRMDAVRKFAERWRVTVVLKGYRSIVALPDGRAYVNTTGNPGMATAGSGDVLTGMIAAFIGSGMPVSDAVLAAVYLHGLSGDLAAEELGEISLKAGDLIEYLPKAICSMQELEILDERIYKWI